MIRIASVEDIPTLAALCRGIFPNSPRWIRRGKRWWSKTLVCPECETWVAETASGLQGFVLFVLDEHGWTRKMAPTSWEHIARGFTLLAAPTVLFGRARARARLKTDYDVDAPRGDGLPEHERLFIELIGVAPQARGSGLGRALVDFGQRRTKELGLRGTCYRVDRRNVPMIALMRSSGLRIVHKDESGYLFSGLVSDSDRTGSMTAASDAAAVTAAGG